MMRELMRGKKIMCISKRRLTQIFFILPILMFGMLMASSSYAEKLNENLAKAIYGPVKASDTLAKIVSRNYPGSNLSDQQIMAGILRANPDAFIGGNIHFLLRGSTLLLPKENLVATISDKDAKTTIKKHYRYFLDGKTGNFQTLPFEDTNIIADEAQVDSTGNDPLITISSDEFRKSKIDELEKQMISRQAPAAVQDNSKKETSIQNSAIKDIELESLKIKVSQLEKILSSRGLSITSSANEVAGEVEDTLQLQKEKIAQLESERKGKVSELRQLQEKITELEASLAKMTESLSDQQTTGVVNTGDTDAKDEVIRGLKKDNEQLLSKLNRLQLALDKKTRDVEELTLEIDTSKLKITELETKLLDTGKENEKLDQQISDIEAKLTNIRQAPTSNQGLTNVGGSGASSGMSPWIWLIPALFLLSILAYLFKRSISQSESIPVANAPASQSQSQPLQRRQPAKKVVTELKRAKTPKGVIRESTPVVRSPVPDVIASASEEESMEASIKLDIAKAYIDMKMSDAAIEILQEAYEEGSQKQRIEAKNLLDRLAV